VSKQLAAERERLPRAVAARVREIRRLSKRLRRDRELAFYGNDDFVPSDEYDADDSDEAIAAAEAIVGWVRAGRDELSAG
jgi:HEPN domain-containing protein